MFPHRRIIRLQLPRVIIALTLLAVIIYFFTLVHAQTTPGVVVDNDHDGVGDNLEQKLVEKYAPIIFIEPDESNYPVNVEWFLARAHLQYHEDCGFFDGGDVDDDIGPNPIGSQSNLIGPPWTAGPHCGEDDEGYSHPPHRQITTIATDPDGQVSAGGATTGYSDQQTFVLPDLNDGDRVGSTNPRDWKTYYHVYPAADGGIMLQYWHVFAYNEFSIAGFGNHGGDWDASIQVQLDRNLQVTGVWFSRHDHDKPGDFLAIGNGRLHFLGTHPLMTIDGGGHAAFADPGDFCSNNSIAGGTIAWPTDLSDPTNPAKLGVFNGLFCPFLVPSGSGGIVWETWTGGVVRATGGLTHPISAPSGHGGLVNLGEYNPCTPATCNGSAQASSLLAGQFHPLNGQIFIRYSGVWGNLPHGLFGSNPPRGPVFQGFHDRGEGKVSVYTAWYNRGANVPAANDGNHPWRVPPTTATTISGPTYTNGGVTYVSGLTQLSLGASQSSIANGFGDVTTFYRIYPAGGVAPAFSPYTGPFTLTSPDGPYIIEYRSVDALDNLEATHTLALTLDTTPPTVTIVQPAATSYVHSATLVLDYSVTDSGSGVQSVTPTIDGATTVTSATTLASHGLADGQAIKLLTELTLGEHTFMIVAVDNVGNSISPSVTFSIIVTPESIEEDVRQFVESADITQDEGTSLLRKLQAARKARADGKCVTANNIYQAFINELSAQSGKHVRRAAAAIMTADAQYLIAHCQ
jgi:FIMAH domain/Bacterial Ig domain